MSITTQREEGVEDQEVRERSSPAGVVLIDLCLHAVVVLGPSEWSWSLLQASPVFNAWVSPKLGQVFLLLISFFLHAPTTSGQQDLCICAVCSICLLAPASAHSGLCAAVF